MNIYTKSNKLVETHIKWMRKWLQCNNYCHSQRVYAAIKPHVSQNVAIAWLLHDIVEDGWLTFSDLRELGYSEEIIALIDYCSHDLNNPDKLGRWKDMMNRIIRDENLEALLIKLADITDNLKDCDSLSPDKRNIFLTIKCSFFKCYGEHYFWWHPLYNKFIETYTDKANKFLLS